MPAPMRPLAHAGAGAAALLALLTGACGGGDGGDSLVVERDTLGDTIVVRTVAGSAWEGPRTLEPEMRIGAFEGEDEYMLGEVGGFAVAPDGSIYIYDRQVPALRKYAPDGTYVATFGREGGGPGEYKQADSGLGVLPDGRVLLRDPGNGRITIYSPDGDYLEAWPLRGGFFTSRPLFVDTAGTVRTQIWGSTPAGERYAALRLYSDAGEEVDSTFVPDWDYEAPTISFSSDRISMSTNVPFSPGETWTFSPHGYFVGGVSTRYAIDLFRPDRPVLRLERVIDPIPVDPDEKANVRARREANFREYAPDWKWNGPDLPDAKPPFREVYAGRDGRIWVLLHQPAVPIPEEEIDTPSEPDAPPPERWREPVVFDVFEPDGTYLGQIQAPDRLQTYPQPVFDGDRVWAVVTDELDVEYLTRFRISGTRTDTGGD
jgi:hypothetical protein